MPATGAPHPARQAAARSTDGRDAGELLARLEALAVLELTTLRPDAAATQAAADPLGACISWDLEPSGR